MLTYFQDEFKLPVPDVVPVLKIWGNALAKEARDNARKYGWRDIPRSIRLSAVDPSARTVTVFSEHVAAGQRHYGGWISAPGKGPFSRQAKFLAIPVDREARGTTPREHTDLQLIVTAKQALLVKQLAGSGKGKQGFKIMFVLKKRVYQKPQPYWPDEARAAEIGRREIERYMERKNNSEP